MHHNAVSCILKEIRDGHFDCIHLIDKQLLRTAHFTALFHQRAFQSLVCEIDDFKQIFLSEKNAVVHLITSATKSEWYLVMDKYDVRNTADTAPLPIGELISTMENYWPDSCEIWLTGCCHPDVIAKAGKRLTRLDLTGCIKLDLDAMKQTGVCLKRLAVDNSRVSLVYLHTILESITDKHCVIDVWNASFRDEASCKEMQMLCDTFSTRLFIFQRPIAVSYAKVHRFLMREVNGHLPRVYFRTSISYDEGSKRMSVGHMDMDAEASLGDTTNRWINAQTLPEDWLQLVMDVLHESAR